MKFIITESQHNRIWLLRRYDLVKAAFDYTINYVNPCKWEDFDSYESYFYFFFMNVLQPEYSLIDNFDYDGTKEELMNLFYVELTEDYYDKKERCL